MSDGDDEKLAEVILLRPRVTGEPSGPTVQRGRVGPWPSCGHQQMVVDGTSRSVRCGDCNAELDPVNCLQQLAMDYDRMLWARDEAKRVSAEIDALKKERDRLKAQVRSATRRKGEA